MVMNKTNRKKINRRDILKLISVGLTTSAINKISGDDIQNLTNPDTSESQFISEPPEVASRPNIIFILGDNHNAGIMG